MASRRFTSAALAAGAVLLLRALDNGEKYSFAGKSVLITGGSRGLGLLMAREMANEGAKLTLLARDDAELERAAQELRERGAQVFTLVCDIRDRNQIESSVRRTMQHYGTIDVLFNNAGTITVGPVEHMELSDFEEAMDVHYWAALHFMRAVIPQMKTQGGGRIVNISSIGGRVAIPHMTPYCASKFALVGLSDGMRHEYAKDNIKITTVCPGVLRTGAHVNVHFKGKQESEYGWFATAASTPLVSMDADRTAHQIVEACRRGAAHLTVSLQANVLGALNALAPSTTAKLLEITNGLLPGPDGADGNQRRTGWDVRDESVPEVLTHFGDKAADNNNELKGNDPLT